MARLSTVAGSSVEQLMASARERQSQWDVENTERELKAQLGGLMGEHDNSRRAYFREFRKVVDAADVVLEVLDARDPEVSGLGRCLRRMWGADASSPLSLFSLSLFPYLAVLMCVSLSLTRSLSFHQCALR